MSLYRLCKSMKYITKSVLCVGVILSGLSGVSCSKSQDASLYAYEASSLNLNSFSLSSAKNSALNSVFFSIKNAKEGGVIANAQPLPYGVALEDITISLGLVTPSVQVEIAFGDEAYKTWSATSKYTIPEGTQIIKLKLSNLGESYIYTVNLNIYKYNPETIDWSSLALAPSLRGSQGELVPIALASETLLYDVSAYKYYTWNESASSLESRTPIAGLAQGESLVRIEQSSSWVVALSSTGKLYQLNQDDSRWEELQVHLGQAGRVVALLGILPNSSESVALIVETSGGEKAFAAYEGNTLKVSPQAIPSDFPWQTQSYKAFGAKRTYEGGSLRLLVTELLGSGAGQKHSSWLTTDALRWVRLSSSEESEGAVGVSYLYSGDLYYRLCSASEGLQIFTSTDATSWTKNGSVAYQGLTQSELANRSLSVWQSADGRLINIFAGANATGLASFYQGKLLKYSSN